MSESAITKIEKRGEWYQIEGVKDGKRVAFEVSAKDLDSRSRKDGLEAVTRSINTAAQQG